MDEIKYFTEEGLKKLKDELDFLERVERPSVSQKIADARDKGDLSENAEYDAAKEEQGMLEAKIAKMKQIISNARLIDESKLDNSKVLILSKVRVKNLNTKAETNYVLVPENESNFKEGKISVNSPVAKGLLGKTVGDTVEISIPAGKIKLKILEISR